MQQFPTWRKQMKTFSNMTTEQWYQVFKNLLSPSQYNQNIQSFFVRLWSILAWIVLLGPILRSHQLKFKSSLRRSESLKPIQELVGPSILAPWSWSSIMFPLCNFNMKCLNNKINRDVALLKHFNLSLCPLIMPTCRRTVLYPCQSKY